MKVRTLVAVFLLCAVVVPGQEKKGYRTSPVGYSDTPVLPGQKWRVHDIARPHPAVVTPGAKPGDPPSDAIVLFDGKDLSHWTAETKHGPAAAAWKVEKGYMEIVPGSGTLVSKEKFSDIQLHIEWAAPAAITGDSQWRGNSGILIMNRYEIQVLDSYHNLTYADGQAGAIYGQWPPLVNAARKPGEWQSYDIVFEAPKFEGGRLVKPAYATVFLNGVLLHNRKEIIGRMAHRVVGTYAPHAAEEPLGLQDHDTPVRYRNIWVRRVKGYDQP
ncbi:MAG: DUF1080 domain-containing protein [Bryobacterales bacterium]|nr:DUF1080 domain-containing protein [Bryobacterales bacterium]